MERIKECMMSQDEQTVKLDKIVSIDMVRESERDARRKRLENKNRHRKSGKTNRTSRRQQTRRSRPVRWDEYDD